MRLLPVLMFLLLVSSVAAQTNQTTSHGFEVNDVVESTTGANSGQLGLVTNIDVDEIYVRWQYTDAAVKTDPNRITKVNKQFPEEFDVRVKGEAIYMPMSSVSALYNEVRDYYETGTCDDGLRNQGETGIDCGGPCPLCEVTPTEDIQRAVSFRSQRGQITSIGTKMYGSEMADAIPAPTLASDDVIRVAKAVENTRWAKQVASDIDDVQDDLESTRQAAENTKTTTDNLRTRIDTVNSNVNQVSDKIAAIERPLPEIKSRLSQLEGATQTGSYVGIGSLIMVLLALSVIGYLTYTVVALKKELHVVTETTDEDLDKLVGYFERMTNKGYSTSVVKRELIKQGFTRPQVDLACKKFEQPEIKK